MSPCPSTQQPSKFNSKGNPSHPGSSLKLLAPSFSTMSASTLLNSMRIWSAALLYISLPPLLLRIFLPLLMRTKTSVLAALAFSIRQNLLPLFLLLLQKLHKLQIPNSKCSTPLSLLLLLKHQNKPSSIPHLPSSQCRFFFQR